MKANKVVLTISAFAVMVVGVMMLSSFTTLNKTAIAEDEYTLAANDNWKLFRENVPFCDGADKCMGTGTVWVNTDTYQVAFQPTNSSVKYDLAEYTGTDGYNMRFWHGSKDMYCYVNIFVPRSAFN